MTPELVKLNYLGCVLFQQHWELELVDESQLREVEMKRSKLCANELATRAKEIPVHAM